jgi:hypothetical protein
MQHTSYNAKHGAMDMHLPWQLLHEGQKPVCSGILARLVQPEGSLSSVKSQKQHQGMRSVLLSFQRHVLF